MARRDVTIFICTTCKAAPDSGERAGAELFDSVSGLLQGATASGVIAMPVECLGVCKRPCTIALSGDGKWTYVVGDLDPGLHAGDVIAAALLYAASADGIVPWRERPQPFRKGMVARIPPLGFIAKIPAQ